MRTPRPFSSPLSPCFVAGALALFNASLLGATLASGGWGAAALITPAGEPELTVETARLLVASATLAAIYEFDARVNASAPRVMRIATEIGVISTALLFTSAAIAFQAALAPRAAINADMDTVSWLARALGLGAMPGLGTWALVAAAVGWREQRLPLWVGFAGAEMALVGAAAFVAPQLTIVFVVLLFAFWVGLGQFFAADEPSSARPALQAG